MDFMDRKVFQVELGRSHVFEDDQVFRVPLLGCLGEIKAPRNDRAPIDDHHLIVEDRMFTITENPATRLGHPCGFLVVGQRPTAVDDRGDLGAACLGTDAGVRNRPRREGVRLDVNGSLCRFDFADNGLGATTVGRKVDLGACGDSREQDQGSGHGGEWIRGPP